MGSNYVFSVSASLVNLSNSVMTPYNSFRAVLVYPMERCNSSSHLFAFCATSCNSFFIYSSCSSLSVSSTGAATETGDAKSSTVEAGTVVKLGSGGDVEGSAEAPAEAPATSPPVPLAPPPTSTGSMRAGALGPIPKMLTRSIVLFKTAYAVFLPDSGRYELM